MGQIMDPASPYSLSKLPASTVRPTTVTQCVIRPCTQETLMSQDNEEPPTDTGEVVKLQGEAENLFMKNISTIP